VLQRRIRRAKRWPASCTGLAAYAALNVDGIRTLFVLRTLVTAGILGLVYIALAFILPIDAKREA
jgi:phage shock protein PspC (stress-responsive transcriptional regulator)